MGYTTDFSGFCTITPALKPEHAAYINAFSNTRRMARRANETESRPDPVRLAVGLPVGPEGAYFVGETGFKGQDEGPDVARYNIPPTDQPGLWCQWIVDLDSSTLEWDGGEKFYDYVEWLEYLVEHFFTPWGYQLDGKIKWKGEDDEDIGMIVVEKNKVTTKTGVVVYT